MIMNSFFKFHPIGQGGFYTGCLDLYGRNHSQFNFVYDCGTLSERNNLNFVIESYKNRICNKTIDVLFISHLDDDHVNGIKELLKDIICNDVYMPYLSPFERLIVSIRHKPKDTNNFDNFINFIKSPHDYLFDDESEVRKITYIKGNSDNKVLDDKNPKEKPDDENLNYEFTDSLELLSTEEFNAEMVSLAQDSKVVFKKANGKLKIGNIWEFYLYNEPASEVQISQFISSIQEIYGITIDKKLSQSDLMTILDNKDKLKVLRDKFKEIFKDLNKTGLVVQHKPLSYRYGKLFKENQLIRNEILHFFNFFLRRFRDYIYTHRNRTNNWGVTLLTGDIGLNQIENSLYIKNNLRYVKVFQIPHHGSKTGWDNNFLKRLNNKGLTSSIINFGYGNTYGHPKPNVLRDLVNDNHDIRFCNQFEHFEYKIVLYFNY